MCPALLFQLQNYELQPLLEELCNFSIPACLWDSWCPNFHLSEAIEVNLRHDMGHRKSIKPGSHSLFLTANLGLIIPNAEN